MITPVAAFARGGMKGWGEGFEILDLRFEILVGDLGIWIRDSRFWIADRGSWICNLKLKIWNPSTG
jgi:hypothetical protein